MPEHSIADDQQRIDHAIQAAVQLSGDDRLRNHLLWEAREVLGRLKLSDFTTAELLAVLAVVCPIHSRLLPRRGQVVVVHQPQNRRLRSVI